MRTLNVSGGLYFIFDITDFSNIIDIYNTNIIVRFSLHPNLESQKKSS